MTGNKCNERFVLLSTASANEGTWNWSRCDVQMGNAIDQCQLLATTEKTVCCLRGFHTHTHACRHSDQAIASLPLHGIRSMPITPKIILFHCTLHTSKVYIYIWRWSIAFRFLGWWESDKHEKKMHTTPKNPGGTMMKATCMEVEGCVLCTRGSLLRQRPTVNSVCVCCVHYMQGRPSIQRHFAEPAGWSLCVCVCVYSPGHRRIRWWCGDGRAPPMVIKDPVGSAQLSTNIKKFSAIKHIRIMANKRVYDVCCRRNAVCAFQ